MEDRRKFPRFKLSVEVCWEKVSGSGEDAPQNQTRMKDISKGGACIVVPDSIKVGDVLELEIKLPGGKSIRARCRVMWIDEHAIVGGEDKIGFEGGVQFIDINGKTRKEINRFLFDLNREWRD